VTLIVQTDMLETPPHVLRRARVSVLFKAAMVLYCIGYKNCRPCIPCNISVGHQEFGEVCVLRVSMACVIAQWPPAAVGLNLLRWDINHWRTGCNHMIVVVQPASRLPQQHVTTHTRNKKTHLLVC
jgi:hypothetical protein